MPRIKFTADYSVRAKGGEHYKSGDIVEVTETSAEHFINRGVAEIAKDEPKSQQRTLTTDTGASDAGASDKPANKRASKSGGSKGSAAN